MPRPRKFDPDTALDAATELFWSRGYDAVSFDDLVAATGASRRSLYALWDGKEALFAAAIARYREQVGDDLFGDMEAPGAGGDAIARFWDKFEASARAEPFNGCLIMRTANQPLAKRPAIGAEIDAYFERFQAAFRAAIAGGKKRGEIAAAVDPGIASCLAFGIAYAFSAVASERGFDPEVEKLLTAGRVATGVA